MQEKSKVYSEVPKSNKLEASTHRAEVRVIGENLSQTLLNIYENLVSQGFEGSELKQRALERVKALYPNIPEGQWETEYLSLLKTREILGKLTRVGALLDTVSRTEEIRELLAKVVSSLSGRSTTPTE